jgi:hypothetical protein
MADRIFKFYGQAFALTGTVAITVKFNGVEIFSGPVPTVNSLPSTQPTNTNGVLFEYVGTTDLVGNIPFELHVTNGTVFFGAIRANYSGSNFEVDQTNPDAPEIVVTTAPENYWADINQKSIESDGKTNVKINGVSKLRHVIDLKQIGDWWYQIPDGAVLTCDIEVDPTIVVEAIPAIEELQLGI